MEINQIIDNVEIIDLMFKGLALIVMLTAAVLDIKEKKIPLCIPTVQMMFSLLYFLYLWSRGMNNPKSLFLSMLPGAILLVTGYLTKQGIGLGDGLMVLTLGPLFGITDIMLVALIAFTLSALVGGVLLLLKKAGGKSVMAFMPFLTVGVGVMSFAFI